MAKDLIPFSGGAERPEWGDGYEYASPYPMTDRPEFLEMRPRYNPESRIERTWSLVVTPFRGAALLFLWLTDSVYKFALIVCTFGVLIALVLSQ